MYSYRNSLDLKVDWAKMDIFYYVKVLFPSYDLKFILHSKVSNLIARPDFWWCDRCDKMRLVLPWQSWIRHFRSKHWTNFTTTTTTKSTIERGLKSAVSFIWNQKNNFLSGGTYPKFLKNISFLKIKLLRSKLFRDLVYWM